MAIKNNPWLLAVFSGLLLSLGWPPIFFNGIIFIALVPLFLIEDHHYTKADKPLQFTFQVWLSLFIWNFFTTYWVWFASKEGAVMAIIPHSLIQAVPWVAFHFTRKVYGNKLAYPALFFYVLLVEYVDFKWDIMWPWLTLGNAFAKVPNWVQWFEYTGTSGGSLWILLINFLFFKVVQSGQWKKVWKPLLYILLPVGISLLILQSYKGPFKNETRAEAVIVQPNIDPYSEKFDALQASEQLEHLIRLSESKLDTSVRLLLWPETALTDNFVEEEINTYSNHIHLKNWLSKYPNLTLISGASTYHFFGENDKVTASARSTGDGRFYDAYNTAIRIKASHPDVFYHKSKLVPGVERTPFIQYLPFLKSLSINMGGTSGTLGISDSAFAMNAEPFKVAPIICYESVFGDYCTEYVRNGANLLAVITNDGWWRNTPGYRQHFDYARLRAIENRRFVARSANTGISGLIDDKGDVLIKSEWWTEDVLRVSIPVRTKITWFSQSGDYIGKISSFLGGLIFLSVFVRRKTKRGY